MDNREFKKRLQIALANSGFKYLNKNYYFFRDDLIVVVDTQKSNFDNSFYINYAFLLKKMHPGVDYPRTNECDVRGRFIYKREGNVVDRFPLSDMSLDELQISLEDNIYSILKPVIADGLMKYFDIYPNAICTATKALKQYLESIK
jgi:hypothetical protein